MVKEAAFDINYISPRAFTPVYVQGREYSDDPAALTPVIEGAEEGWRRSVGPIM